MRHCAGTLAGRAPSYTAAGAAAAVLAAAGILLGTGALASGDASAGATTGAAWHSGSAVRVQAHALLASRAGISGDELSRSAARPPLAKAERATKTSALSVSNQDVGGALTTSVPPATPRQIALALLPSYGWDSSQFSCLDAIWTRESNWNPRAANSSSGAFGIPQALPGSKMATVATDWATNPETQIKWGLGYIRSSYGSPCGAWSFWESHSWY